jgi:hypothetical protein
MKKFLLLVAILISEYLVCNAIFSGGIPFWFDPARDLLLGLKNSMSLTFIGPPSGIPGIFYGPYWIWILSCSMKITRDPGLITLFVLGIPYAVVYPIILFKFDDTISPVILFIVSLLFITNFLQYAVQLWNPHLASLFILLAIYIVTKSDMDVRTKYVTAGIVLGLLLTIHISFGSVVVISTIIFILIHNKRIRKILFLFIGISITLIPFVLFEIRHSFLQSRTVWTLLSTSLEGKFSLVSEKGLSKLDVLQNYLSIFSKIFGDIERAKVCIFLLVAAGIILLFRKIKTKVNLPEKEIFLFCTIILLVTLVLYLLARNPVWTYHFIGLETPILLIIAIIAGNFRIFNYLFYLGFIINGYIAFHRYVIPKPYDPETNSTFALKRHVVNDVIKNSGGFFSYYAYSEGVYTYDYDYLFDWLAGARVVKGEVSKLDHVYLIIPKTSWAVFQDFINFKTPNSNYKTIWAKTYKDGTTLILRSRS